MQYGSVITDIHHCAKSEAEVCAISSSFLAKNKLDWFWYGKVFSDKRATLLTTSYRVSKHHINSEYEYMAPLSDKTKILQGWNFFITSMNIIYSKTLHEYRSFFNIDNLIGMVKKNIGYIEICLFGESSKNQNIINFYLNNLKTLENFVLLFKDKAKKLISDSERNKIILTPKMCTNINAYFNLDECKQNSLNSTLSLTKREMDCIRQIMKGKTSKKIAQSLEISHKTVEFHVANIKSKLNCYRKSDIVDTYLKSFESNI